MAVDIVSTVRTAIDNVFSGALSQLVEEVIIYNYNTADAYNTETGAYSDVPISDSFDYDLPARSILSIPDPVFGYQVLHADATSIDIKDAGIFIIRNFGDRVLVGIVNEDIRLFSDDFTMTITVNDVVYSVDFTHWELIPDLPTFWKDYNVSYDNWTALRPWGNINSFSYPVFYYLIEGVSIIPLAEQLRDTNPDIIHINLITSGSDPEFYATPLNGIFSEYVTDLSSPGFSNSSRDSGFSLSVTGDKFIARLSSTFDVSRLQADLRVKRVNGNVYYRLKSFVIDPTDTVCEMVLAKEEGGV